MALSLEQIRDGILKSIEGRRLGIGQFEVLAGPTGYRLPVADASSATTGTAITNRGHVTITATTLSTLIWLLTNPIAGIPVTITSLTTSTSVKTLERPSTAFVITSSEGSTMTTIVMTGGGATITLVGLSTAIYAVLSRSPSTGTVSLNGTT